MKAMSSPDFLQFLPAVFLAWTLDNEVARLRNMNLSLSTPLSECVFTAFDLETSGANPVGSEIVEFGAVKFHRGQEIGRLQFLFKPRVPMSDFIIGIHGITNEMVADAPSISEKIREIQEFLQDSVGLAHHAPFDMGFLQYEFEKNLLPSPRTPVVCTSLLSRNLIYGSENHRLQTLIRYLGIEQGTAHRAIDDSIACYKVALNCFQRMPEGATLEDAIKKQTKTLNWFDYALRGTNLGFVGKVTEAIEKGLSLDIQYSGGSRRSERRIIRPVGMIRNPNGDYIVAICNHDKVEKKFYIKKIVDLVIVE